MTETEITILQEKLNKEKAFAFSEETPHAPTLSDIVSQLNAIEDSDKPSFYDFVYNLKADLFSKSVNIKGLNLSDFTNNSQPEIQQSEEVLNEKIENQVNLAFIDLYKENLIFYN